MLQADLTNEDEGSLGTETVKNSEVSQSGSKTETEDGESSFSQEN